MTTNDRLVYDNPLRDRIEQRKVMAATKPIVFLSHSARDSSLVESLKASLRARTSDVIEYFASSDGESIRVGTNWVSSVEKALESAKLMFVLVSNSSRKSNWVLFESGYAYARGLQVVPVGIQGVDIGVLPPPLSLLQGFNVSDERSLSNFVVTINEAFGYDFPIEFERTEYDSVFAGEAAGLFGRNSGLVDSLSFFGTNNAEHSIAELSETFFRKSAIDFSVNESFTPHFAVTQIDSDGIGILVRTMEQGRESFTIDVDPVFWERGVDIARQLFKAIRSLIVNKPHLRLRLQNVNWTFKDRYRLLPRLKLYGVSLENDGYFRLRGETSFDIGNMTEFSDDGDTFEGQAMITFRMDIESVNVAAVSNVLDLLVQTNILGTSEWDYW